MSLCVVEVEFFFNKLCQALCMTNSYNLGFLVNSAHIVIVLLGNKTILIGNYKIMYNADFGRFYSKL